MSELSKKDRQLPKTNPNEDLEDISSSKFRLLLDPEKFSVNKGGDRDKGIDFAVEIKLKGVHTNFRFNVQLKATDSSNKNSDGSTSLSISTANLNYLLNAGIPAYYILYIHKEDTFLYLNAGEFVSSLTDDHKDWLDQDSHTLRFSKILDESAIQNVYDHVVDRGRFGREISEKIVQYSSIQSSGSVVVDKDLQVITDDEIEGIIEKFGHAFINEARWVDLISLHERGSQSIGKSGKYRLAVGVAYYYNGDLLKSLDWLRRAAQQKTELESVLKDHLEMFESLVKYSLGIIDQKQYASRMSKFENSEFAGIQVRIDKAKRRFQESLEEDKSSAYEALEKDLRAVAEDPDVSQYMKLIARGELVFLEGSVLSGDCLRTITSIKAGEALFGFTEEMKNQLLAPMNEKINRWRSHVYEAKLEAQKSGAAYTFYYLLVNEVKIEYQLEVYSDLDGFSLSSSPLKGKQKIADLSELVAYLDSTISYYKKVNYIENLITTLATKYEVLHYMEYFEEANLVMDELSILIESYDMPELGRKFALLKDKGTTHEKLAAFIEHTQKQGQAMKAKFDSLVDQIGQLDALDEQRSITFSKPGTIELYPLGYFQFPSERRSDVYRILNLSDQTKRDFDKLLDQSKVPAANMFHQHIEQLGSQGGMSLEHNIQAWRNIYRVRNLFFKNGFPRVMMDR